MAFEETGVRRVPPRRERRNAENDSEENEQDAHGALGTGASAATSTSASHHQTILAESDLTTRQLQEITRITQARGRELQQAILAHHVGDEDAQMRRWRQRRQDWGTQISDAYTSDTGERMTTANPVQMLRLLWRCQNRQLQDQTLEDYQARANWEAWNMFARQSQVFVRELEAELAAAQEPVSEE
ncbi:hypothetical protein Z517_09736 [Fonsecaea pedrosoi CBS 271.37]|uniref:Uncharacterized protein n=1 Tax=Fonsecaea pedrosoi CBS 271.37 TaxID=1442368 RepID=A0A0D2GF65_9EURO|nr:uncharacterized protein Z517_09736 [Fonsecaea pedrosoi CBS 271.37]KIW77290.1 hypothetical protein Z517_09736 [Fonsecaea pedrosoi CBS 271.37]